MTSINIFVTYNKCIKIASTKEYFLSSSSFFNLIFCTAILYSNPHAHEVSQLIYFTINLAYIQNCNKLIVSAMAKMRFGFVHQEIVVLYVFTLLMTFFGTSRLKVMMLTAIFFVLCFVNCATF